MRLFCAVSTNASVIFGVLSIAEVRHPLLRELISMFRSSLVGLGFVYGEQLEAEPLKVCFSRRCVFTLVLSIHLKPIRR